MRQEILKAAVLVWIIGSVLYIGWDTWNDFRIREVQQAYQSGVTDTVKQIFDKSKDGQCKQPIELSSGADKLGLIDVTCLQQPSEKDNSQVPPVTTKK